MESQTKFRLDSQLKLMDQVREVFRYHHYAYSTEQTFCQWVLRYIRVFGNSIHPRDSNFLNVERFLSGLALRREVSASTRRQV